MKRKSEKDNKLTKREAVQVLKSLEESRRNCSQTRSATFAFLTKIYRLVRQNRENKCFVLAVASLKKRRVSGNHFVNVLDITWPAHPSPLRWKYGLVLSIADERRVAAADLGRFITEGGGFDAVLRAESRRASWDRLPSQDDDFEPEEYKKPRKRKKFHAPPRRGMFE